MTASSKSPTTPYQKPDQNTTYGIYLITLSTFLFTIMDSLIKWTGETYPVMQLLFFRTTFAMIPILLTLWTAGGLQLLKTKHPIKHFIRGTIGMGAMYFVFNSFIKLPMAEVVSILFAVPIIVSVMAVLILKEKIGIHRAGAILVGFMGVLVIVQPGPDLFSSDTIYPLTAAVLMAMAMIILRILGRTEHGASIAFYFTLYGIIVSTIGMVALEQWVMPTPTDWALLISIGILGGLAQYTATRSFAVAEIAVISPFKYTALIWSATIAYFIWGEIPAWDVWIGASIIVASSLYILHREIYWSRKNITASETPDTKSKRLKRRLLGFILRN